MSRSAISIFGHVNYRTFLNEHHALRKKARTTWSLGAWAKQLGLRSPSGLAMILNGHRNPGATLTRRFAENLRLSAQEAEYFQDLVHLEKTKDDVRVRLLLLDKLSRSSPKGSFHYLDHDVFATISHWYFYAIREMVQMKGFREDPDWIAAGLKFRVSAAQIERAIATLLRVGLLRRLPGGRLAQANGAIDTATDVADEGLKRCHEQALDHAKASLREEPLASRELYGTTFVFPTDRMPEAKQLIRKFHQEFCDLLEKPGADSVYHLEVAFFPLAVAPKEKSSV